MHEGDHSILQEDDDQHHKHHNHPHDHHEHEGAAPNRGGLGARAIAAIIVGAAVVVFLIWRFM